MCLIERVVVCRLSDVESGSLAPDRLEITIVKDNAVLVIFVVVFLFAYFIASVLFLMLTWCRGAATSGYRVPAIPYCKFPGRRWRGNAPAGTNDFVGPPSDAS